MEDIIKTELTKSASSIIKNATEITPTYLVAMQNALKNFEVQGLPTKKLEDWKYTNITKNLSHNILEPKDGLAKPMPKNFLDPRAVIVFNNGVFNKFLSVLPEGIEILPPSPQDQFFDSFDCLNFASASRSIYFRMKKNVIIDYPISIIHQVDEAGVNKMITPRFKFHAQSNSKAYIVEIFTSNQDQLYQYTTNASSSFILDDNAAIEHVKIQIEAKNSQHVGLTKAEINRSARFNSMTIDLGNQTSRHNICIDLIESGAETQVHGLYALAKDNHCDVFSQINHLKAHTSSDQLFKGILADQSHGVFTGKITVQKDAQQITSAQLNKNLVLSRRAHVDTRPQLLVSADDVKCAHGATVGQLSKDEEFYLESRGIPKPKAKIMLCHGFGLEVINKIENTIIRNFCEKMFINKFEDKVLN